MSYEGIKGGICRSKLARQTQYVNVNRGGRNVLVDRSVLIVGCEVAMLQEILDPAARVSSSACRWRNSPIGKSAKQSKEVTQYMLVEIAGV